MSLAMMCRFGMIRTLGEMLNPSFLLKLSL
jgi:hypothetical protein